MRTLIAAAAAAALLAAGAQAQAPARPPGYLPAGAIDALALVPPPPEAGSPAMAADLAWFRTTRSQQGGPRWRSAVAEDRIFPPEGLAHFRCALGVALDDQATPTLSRMMSRVIMDASAVAAPVKTRYARARPYAGDDAAPLCITVDRKPSAAVGSYPSSHAVAGWAWGLILAELAPERASALIARGREFGDNRTICGVHYPSDIEAGRVLGAALVARLHAEPAFRADLDAARVELAAARTKAPPAACPA